MGAALGEELTMNRSKLYRLVATALALLLIATPGQARSLMEIDGIELRGAAQVVMHGAATCHIREINHSEEEYERLKVNEGKLLDLWRLDFSVYNGSGKALDHLIARYNIESQWPPCTNWSYNPESPTTSASWSSQSGHIQRTAKPFSVTPGETLTEELFFIVFHEDTPQFANWSVDYNFVEGTHAAPAGQPAETPAEPPAEQTAQTQATASPPAQAQAAAPPPQDSDMPAGISAGETCTGKPEKSACWMELDSRQGCYVWNEYLAENETVTWSGTCADGLAEGSGEIVWVWGSDRENSHTGTGQMQQGKEHGQWVIRYASGNVFEGPYVDGKRHGQWVVRLADGGVQEGPYVDGKRHGQWVVRLADGGVQEGPYVEGKQHGQWVLRYASGNVFEGPVVDGKQHGQWVLRFADGGVQEGPYVDGKQHGRWVLRFADGGVDEGPYVDGKRHGQWNVREADGSIDIYQYVDGDANGDWLEREPEEVRALLKTGVDVNATFYEGKFTALQIAASEHRPVEIILALLEAGADVNAKLVPNGRTPLHSAVKMYSECNDNGVAIVKALLEAGANARARMSDGLTPLHEMTGSSDCDTSTASEIVAMLVGAGANINAGDMWGNTPLHNADESPQMIPALLNAGADINRKNNNGQTALHRAVMGNERDRLFRSVRHYNDPEGEIQAIVSDSAAAAMALLVAGADPTVRDANGMTPLDYIGDDSLLKNTDIYWELQDAQRQ